MSDILQKIVEHKRGEIEAARKQTPPETLKEQVQNAPPVRNFLEALQNAVPVALIAEVKKASPSAGVIRSDFDPLQIARTYEQHGAACLSVLTDEHFFQGSLDDLRTIRGEVSVPVLRKDFILDRYQILEARAAGADAVLLIAECLDDYELNDLYQYTTELGMMPLIESYGLVNLHRVLKLLPSPQMVGINNRNLETFDTDLEHSVRLAMKIPTDTLLISESGIRTRDDVLQLQQARVGAILVGETLMREDDIGSKVDELLGNG